jgi:hypothetical protein
VDIAPPLVGTSRPLDPTPSRERLEETTVGARDGRDGLAATSQSEDGGRDVRGLADAGTVSESRLGDALEEDVVWLAVRLLAERRGQLPPSNSEANR